LLKLIGLIGTVAAGFGLGRAPFKVRVRIAVPTALLAAVVQTSLKIALPHDAIDKIAQSQLNGAWGQIIMFALAMIETAGVLLPVVLMPWAGVTTRTWATVYVLGAAVLAAATYYFPFDVVIVNGQVVGPKRPPYELGLLLCLPFAAVGYLVGYLRSRGHRTAAQP
jgi:hypothetical protein